MMHTVEIAVGGAVAIGRRLDLVERINDSRDVDGLRYRQTIEHALIPTEEEVAFEGEGLTQGYIVFGQPGAGKTHFIRTILGQLLSKDEDEADRRFGGMILDPKGDYPRFLSDAVRRLPGRRAVPPIIIHPSMPKAINILHCELSPDSLAKVLSATVSALAKGADEYFHNNLYVVLTSILVAERTLARRLPRKVPSLWFLLELLTGFGTDPAGQRVRRLQLHVKDLQIQIGKDCDLTWDASERAEIQRAVDNLTAFLKEEKSYVVTQLFKQAFEAFQRLPVLSGDAEWGRPNLYDDILNSGRVVLVSIPPSETYARSVFTLMKNIFQKVVLDRYARFEEGGGPGKIGNRVRPVFLICDEYHLSASDAPEAGVGDSTFLSLARAFGCFSLMATQGLDQLKTSAIGERWEALIGLFRAKLFFSVGDRATAELACELAGEEQSLFVGTSLSEGREGKTWGASDQLTMRQHLPRFVVLRGLARGQAAIVGSLDGKGVPTVKVVQVGGGWP